MKLLSVLCFAAGVHQVSAVIGAPICLAACTPLLINPIAYAACAAGCAALGVEGEGTGSSPKFLEDGSIVFEKESPECAEACKPLSGERLTYSACLGGCAAKK